MKEQLTKTGTPKQAWLLYLIRRKCVDDCCCGSKIEAEACELEECPIWQYRLGNRKPIPYKTTPESE